MCIKFCAFLVHRSVITGSIAMNILKILVTFWQIAFHDGCQIYVSLAMYMCAFLSVPSLAVSWVLRSLEHGLFSGVLWCMWCWHKVGIVGTEYIWIASSRKEKFFPEGRENNCLVIVQASSLVIPITLQLMFLWKRNENKNQPYLGKLSSIEFCLNIYMFQTSEWHVEKSYSYPFPYCSL